MFFTLAYEYVDASYTCAYYVLRRMSYVLVHVLYSYTRTRIHVHARILYTIPMYPWVGYVYPRVWVYCKLLLVVLVATCTSSTCTCTSKYPRVHVLHVF